MIEEFITYLRSIRGYSYNTCKAYEKDVRQFAEWVNAHQQSARWSSITRKDIDNFVKAQCDRGLKPSTTNRQIASISSLYRFFQREGYNVENPCKYESRRKIPETMPTTIPINDLQRAYNNSKGAAKLMIGILLSTGIRLQEMLNLTWADINIEESSMRINGKGSKERIVYTSSNVIEMLRPIQKYSQPHMKLFYFQQRTARQIIYDAIQPYTKVRQYSPHIIRHTYATELAKGGFNAMSIGKILGHKSISTTQKYVNMAQIDDSRKASNSIMFHY